MSYGIVAGAQEPEANPVATAAEPAMTPKPEVAPAPSLGESFSATLDEKPIFAGWDKGFFIRSKDRDFVLRLTGQIQADYRDYFREPDSTDIDTFLVRRARFGLEANMFNYYEFRLLPDFGQGVARVQDAYLNVHYWDCFQFEAGKFKQPFSYEQLIQDRFVPTMERSLIDQLVPARDVGVMVHGQNLLDGRLDFGMAVANGVINGDSDTNDYKDYAGRIVLRPFGPNAGEWIRGAQVGVSATTGVEKEPVSPNTLRTPSGVPWFRFDATVRADGLRNRVSPEVAYFNGPFGFAAQYFWEEQELRQTPIAPIVDLPFQGYYVLATYLLTGERRTTYSQPIAPLRPFDPRSPWSNWGAWEIVARLSHLAVDEAAFAPGARRLADPLQNAHAATELTIGFNWYLNEWVRWQFNWEHDWFSEPVLLSTSPRGLLQEQDALLLRFQVIF